MTSFHATLRPTLPRSGTTWYTPYALATQSPVLVDSKVVLSSVLMSTTAAPEQYSGTTLGTEEQYGGNKCSAEF
eukprot:3885079-Rhodomonas_salina.2